VDTGGVRHRLRRLAQSADGVSLVADSVIRQPQSILNIRAARFELSRAFENAYRLGGL